MTPAGMKFSADTADAAVKYSSIEGGMAGRAGFARRSMKKLMTGVQQKSAGKELLIQSN